MRILVTGAGGMLADAIKVLAENIRDDAFGIFFSQEEQAAFQSRFPNNAIIPLGAGLGDVSRLERLMHAVRTFRPDWIVHCAAWTDVDGCESDPKRSWDSNAIACLEVALAAREQHTRLITISTDYVFDGTATTPYVESAPPNPISNYGRAKFAGETFARLVTDEHLVIRTAWLFGPYGKNFVDTIRTHLLSDKPVRVVNDQRGCPTYVEDLAVAIRILAEKDARGLFHVANSGDATWFELAEAIGEQLGKRHLVSATSTAELGRPAPRPSYSVLDCSSFAAASGRPLPHWRDALARYLRG